MRIPGLHGLFRLVAAQLKMGLTPEKLAWSVVLGVVIGVIPVLGATTILCGVAAASLGLNQPVIQSVNYVVYPIQIAMLIPFMRAGEWIFGSSRSTLSAKELMVAVARDPLGAVSAFWTITLKALVAWSGFGFATALVLYPMIVAVLRRMARARGAQA